MQMVPVDDDSESHSQRINGHFRSHSSEEELAENMSGLEAEETIVEDSIEERANVTESQTASALVAPRKRQPQILGRKLSSLKIPNRGELLGKLENDKEVGVQSYGSFPLESPTSGQETAAQAFECEAVHSDEKHDGDDNNEVEIIPEESILKRISSLKGTKSYQLGKQLSCKWTTGAGPRIGCVRDYPCELQFRALEQVNLSPRSDSRTKLSFALRTPTGLSSGASMSRSLFGTALNKGSMSHRDDHHSRSESLPLFRGTSVIPVIHTSE